MRGSLIFADNYIKNQTRITDEIVERGEFSKACEHISKLALYQVSCAIEFFNKWIDYENYQAALLKLMKSIVARHEETKHKDFSKVLTFFQTQIDYLLSIEDYNQLIQLFNEWDETTPKLQSFLVKAIGRSNQIDFKMVNSFHLEVTKRYPNHTQSHINHAFFLVSVEKYAYALAVIDKVLLQASEHKKALLCKARILTSMHSFQAADDFLSKLLERNPNFSQALHARAWVHIHLNNVDMALSMLEEINRRFSSYSEARLDYAIQLQLASRFEDSLPVILDVISNLEKKPKLVLLANAHAALALAYRETKQYKNAEEIYSLICKRFPWQWKAIYEYGDFLSKLEDFQAAIPIFLMAIKGLDHHLAKSASAHELAKLYHSLSIAYIQEKQYEVSKIYLKKAKKADPNYAPIYSTEEHQRLAHFHPGNHFGNYSDRKESIQSGVRSRRGFLKHTASKVQEGFEVARRLDPKRFNNNHNPQPVVAQKVKVEMPSSQPAMSFSNVDLQREESPNQSVSTQISKRKPKKVKPYPDATAPAKPSPAFIISEIILPIIEADPQIPEIIDLKKPDQIIEAEPRISEIIDVKKPDQSTAKTQSDLPPAIVPAPSYPSINTLYNLFSCCKRRKSNVLLPSDKKGSLEEPIKVAGF